MGVSIAIIATIIFCIKIKAQNRICFKYKKSKIFLFFYIFGLSLTMFSIIHFSWFYVETGRYTYKCTFDDSVSANSIEEKFNTISVEDGI